MKNPEWCIWGLCTGYIVGCTNAWHARLSRKLFLVFLPNWILGDSQGTYIVGVISKEEYYGLFIGFRPSGRVQPVQLWWLVNLPVNSLSQIFTFDLLRLTIKAAIAFDLCVLIRGSILLIVCVLADFEIGCKIHWNHFTDEPIMPSYATVSFAQLHGNDLKWWPICSRWWCSMAKSGWRQVLLNTPSNWENPEGEFWLLRHPCQELDCVGLLLVPWLNQPMKWRPMKWNGILPSPSNVFVWDCDLTPTKWEWTHQQSIA